MDTLMKKFFSDFDSAAAPLAFTGDLTTRAYLHAGLIINDKGLQQNRFFYATQDMTTLGKLCGNLSQGTSSLDGVSKQFLTPEGLVNISMISDQLRVLSGMQTPMISAHIGQIRGWDWGDNHVSLLYNMLRYSFIMAMQEEVGNLSAKMGVYDDGHVKIDMDQYFDELLYPEEADFMGQWPGGKDSDNYPSYLRFTDLIPNTDVPFLDLRTLNLSQARFVLLMLGAWQRRSRVRIDFSLGKLTDAVYYRSDMQLTDLDSWMEPKDLGKESKMPELISSVQAWNTIKAYVTQNRLYDHFSVAMYLICATLYQFKPVTAEGIYWLNLDWVINLPTFRSIRGRYVWLNEGEAALVSHRALNEWGYVGGEMAKINLMALCFSQAIQTGIAVRSVRKGLEDNPNDLYTSAMEFYQAVNMTSAAAAEALRCEVPMSGMPGVYVYCNEQFEDVDANRLIETMNENDDDLEGYETEVIEVPDEEAAEEAEVEEISEEATSKKKKEKKQKMKNKVYILSPRMTFAGFPTMIVPLAAFPFPNPFEMKGKIKCSEFRIGRNGTKLNLRECWYVSNILRLCGYDTEIARAVTTEGASRYFAPNDISFTWPILASEGEENMDVMFLRQTQRDKRFIALPPLHGNYSRDVDLDFHIRVLDRGVTQTYGNVRQSIIDVGGTITVKFDTRVAYNIPEGVRKLRGFITRDDQGFRFVDTVQGGVIPPLTEMSNVNIAGETEADGG